VAAPGGLEATADQVAGLRFAGVLAGGAVAAGSLLELGVLCPLRRATGVPCPLCGLTTGVAEVAQGDVAASFASHPLALVAFALLVAVWTPVGPTLVAHARRHPTTIATVLAVVWVGRLAGLYGS
jgi:hypothetical protein